MLLWLSPWWAFGVSGILPHRFQKRLHVSTEAVSGGDLRIAVVRMDAIQTDAKVLADLNKQRTSYETKLRDELSNRQKDKNRNKNARCSGEV